LRQRKEYRTNILHYYLFTTVAVTTESSLVSLLVQVSCIYWSQTESTAEGEHQLCTWWQHIK